MIAEQLSSKGYDIHIIVDDYGQENKFKHEGITFWKTNIHSSGQSRTQRVLNIGRILAKISPDVVYQRGAPHLSIVSCALSRSLSIRFVHHISSDKYSVPSQVNQIDKRIRIPFIYSLKYASNVIAQTDRQKSGLRELGVDATVIPNFYEIPSDDQIVEFEERAYHLWVGRISNKVKKPHRLFPIAENLPGEEFKIIGRKDDDDDYYEFIKNRCGDLENTEFLGFIPPDEIHKYYSRAITLINTSDYEGFPSTFLESWAYATPIISMHFDLNRTLFDGIGGWLCEDVSECINNNSQKQMRDRGLTGREYMIDNYSTASVVEKLESEFNHE
jgi:glycosyltransferase involved in cell wall biosynthesis